MNRHIDKQFSLNDLNMYLYIYISARSRQDPDFVRRVVELAQV